VRTVHKDALLAGEDEKAVMRECVEPIQEGQKDEEVFFSQSQENTIEIS